MNDSEKKAGYGVEGVEFSQNELNAHNERIDAKQEKEAKEQSREGQQEREASARHEIEQVTDEKERVGEKAEAAVERSSVERPANTKAARKKAYDSIVKQTQSELHPASRAFSKVIHNPVIEKTSEIAGSTIARPNAILSGAIFAFLITLSIYVVARANGYPLSGFETIAGFIAGWIIGILYDFFKVMITGKK